MAGLSKHLYFVPSIALIASACGGPETDTHTEIKRTSLNVAADPPGHEFQDSVEVVLSSDGPADIFYTLDGTSPAGENGIRYRGPILLQKSVLLTFVAVDGERFSAPVTELYKRQDADVELSVVGRALRIDDDNLVFSAQRGAPGVMRKTVRLRSVGLQEVHIEDIYITYNPRSWSFWEEGVFELETDFEAPGFLLPGQSIDLTVAYTPTETIRTGILVVQSNEERTMDGYVLVDLMGRIFDW